MVSVLAFLTSPLGRVLGVLALSAGLVAGLWWWDSARIARHEEAATLACNAAHARAAAKAEADARADIRAREEAAYRKGVADSQHRADDTAARETETETVIKEVVRNVPAICVFDAAAADQLNRLRRDP